MKQSKLRRLLSWKIHCPFNCLCKHFYSQDKLKLKNNTHPVPDSGVVSGIRDGCGEGSEVKEESVEGEISGGIIRSCIRKSSGTEEIEKKKKRVQWVDNIGQQLSQIKEFESSETGDETENEEENRNCVCFIL